MIRGFIMRLWSEFPAAFFAFEYLGLAGLELSIPFTGDLGG
jgi:hypothetical protein